MNYDDRMMRPSEAQAKWIAEITRACGTFMRPVPGIFNTSLEAAVAGETYCEGPGEEVTVRQAMPGHICKGCKAMRAIDDGMCGPCSQRRETEGDYGRFHHRIASGLPIDGDAEG